MAARLATTGPLMTLLQFVVVVACGVVSLAIMFWPDDWRRNR